MVIPYYDRVVRRGGDGDVAAVVAAVAGDEVGYGGAVVG